MNDTDLDNLRSDKRFKTVLAKVQAVGDYLDILQKAPGYTLSLIHIWPDGLRPYGHTCHADGPNPSKPATRPAYRQCPAPNIAKYKWLRAANDAARRNGTNKDGLNRASACRQG